MLHTSICLCNICFYYISKAKKQMEKKRVAIIGAGPSGLAQLRAFHSALASGADIPQVVCFEKQSDWGGLWNYNWRTGLDEHGELCHASMYRNLWSNVPKECHEMGDYSFQEHFGRPIGSFPPRPVLLDYIKGRAEKSQVRQWVRFNSPVRMVTYSDASSQFTLTAHDHTKDKMYSEQFDYVIVATGHFSVPNVPYFDGIEGFQGLLLHSHDLRDVEIFRDKDVLIVGGSYSAEDIGSQCYKYGAKSITISYRSRSTGLSWPDKFLEVPLLQRIEGNTCYFLDGSSKQIDAIIFCTGYMHHFPFLEDNLRLKTNNRFWPLKLFRGVVWEDNTKLMYLGMQNQIFSFNMFDAQAWFVRDVIMGRIQLPSKKEMQADSQAWRAREKKLVNNERSFRFQADYVRGLTAATDYPTINTDEIVEMFLQFDREKHKNPMQFRDHSYRSVVTGSLAAKSQVPWINAMDDSLETYVSFN